MTSGPLGPFLYTPIHADGNHKQG